ncbi:MAG: aminopeptidase [Candidatus Heimdallarchaeota archaeon]
MYKEIANRIIEEALNIAEEDSVVISAWEHTVDFASALASEIQKTGADVLILTETDDLYVSTLTELPDKFLRKPQKLSIALLDAQTVGIATPYPKDPAIFEKMPKERFGILGERFIPYDKKNIERKVRSIDIQIGLVTPERAKIYGLDYDFWMAEMTDSLAVSYMELKKFGTQIAERLDKAQEVHVQASGGTDVKFKVSGRNAHIFDGVVDSEDITKGRRTGRLPAGSVSIAPLETSTMGKVVANIPKGMTAKWIKNLEWNFEDGLLKTWNASENFEIWDNFYKGGTGDKNRIAAFDLGINPKAKTGFFHDSIVKGVVTIRIGDNKYLGGANEASITDFLSITDATVKLDGQIILENGQYRI